MEQQKFRNALQEESTYPATENIYNYIISAGKRITLKKNDVLIGYDEINADIYFILDGIIRGTIINGDGIERTVGFGLCGTMIYSAQCYSVGNPSIYQFQACCDTVVIRIKKPEFDRHIAEDHEFCKWVLGSFSLAICYKELRNEGLNGDALFKYKWLQEKRPEIINLVSDKIIASYLNITEVHLSRIKSKILKEKS